MKRLSELKEYKRISEITDNKYFSVAEIAIKNNVKIGDIMRAIRYLELPAPTLFKKYQIVHIGDIKKIEEVL